MEKQLIETGQSIVWPQAGVIEVSEKTDFIYIMRKDTEFAVTPLTGELAEDYGLDASAVEQSAHEAYDAFFARLADVLSFAFQARGAFELHVYDPIVLDTLAKQKAGQQPIVSLDPLLTNGVLQYKVSRGYYLSGKADFGQVARPGSASLAKQASDTKAFLQTQPTVVAEDDLFSGGSVIASLLGLKNEAIAVEKVVPGIQIGSPAKLAELGIPIDPVVSYKTSDGSDIFEKVDLGDPRDFLIGASGLVVKLPNGVFGRAPYVLPFVSPAERAGVPAELEVAFSTEVLKASAQFYKQLEQELGVSVLLEHVNPEFVTYMHELFGTSPSTPMEHVLHWCLENMADIWQKTQQLGTAQESIAQLKLPPSMVFIDVNGTLIDENANDGSIPDEQLADLQQAVQAVKAKGVGVGLCSDSPLPQLQAYAEMLGLDGPIIAENGSIVAHGDQKLVLKTMEDLTSIKQHITAYAATLSCQQQADCIAPEFGGVQIPVGDWAFGANRETSVAVFGGAEIMAALKNRLLIEHGNLSVDHNPDFPDCLMVHQGDFADSKGQTLALLQAFGHQVLMIGNSMSDWVDPDSGVACAFVADARISDQAVQQAAYLSNQPLAAGVAEIIGELA